MALDSYAYQSLIVTQVGDTSDALIASQIATLWDLNDDQSTLKLQFLTTKRAAIEMLMGTVRQQVTFEIAGDHRRQQSDKLKNLQIMLATVNDEIDRYAASGIGTDSDFAAATGDLTTTTPISPPSAAGPDANDRAYRGDPYRRRRYSP